MSEYKGFFAEFYDILHEGQNEYIAYTKLAEKYGKRILELGSGTGRITIPLAKEGMEVTGLEYNEDMLFMCKEKLEKEEKLVKENVKLFAGDAKNFKIDDKFNMIIAPCNFINHFFSFEELEQVVECVKAHLTEDGVFIIDNSLPSVECMMDENGLEMKSQFMNKRTGYKILNSFTPRYNFVDGIEEDIIKIQEVDGDGNIVRMAESNEKLAFYFPREIRYLLHNTGMEIVEERGNLMRGGTIGKNSGEMVFIARKNK
ncbi:class I SAM-dependent methyltransferase [Oceanirhabdus sp. W0125-5]|uniref:class I SAM-dependent methyltransferase n=1 Tax=Oceanirhabdus sp. W0125-5 TaxID=2999116 RepID=UPI0022F32B47|nr:class I SAM-dependent methyltransferase [Oceanirhabdus sp. W0125-5]WBW96660.1 class I SAM-dependent methyltransferase [Oceanirhabdus sp. W0125-5]